MTGLVALKFACRCEIVYVVDMYIFCQGGGGGNRRGHAHARTLRVVWTKPQDNPTMIFIGGQHLSNLVQI